MKRLYLTSAVSFVAKDIAKHIGKVKGLKLAFINTPAELEKKDLEWQDDDRNSLVEVGFDIFDYTITDKTKEQIKNDLSVADVIYISGGNQFYLLEKIQQTDCADVIRDYVAKGKIYIGTSAGSMIAGGNQLCGYRPDLMKGVGKLKDYQGLGLVDFIVFPHWGSKDFEEKYFGFRLKHSYTEKDKVILLTNYQYVKVEGDMYRVIDIRD